MDYNNFEPISFISQARQDSFNSRYDQSIPYATEEDQYGWFDRTIEQVKAYNTLSLFFQEPSMTHLL